MLYLSRSRKILRELTSRWLEHLESYLRTTPGVLDAVVRDHELAAAAERDATLRLHRLRGDRIEDDVSCLWSL